MKILLQCLFTSWNLEFQKFGAVFFIFLRVHFGKFHEVVIFKAARKIRIAQEAKLPYKNVNRRHCLQEPSARCLKALIDF